VDSVIHLRKNTNNNQVHYAVQVDSQCRPLDRRTVRAYWRMLEDGPDITEALMLWERPGYGVRQPSSIAKHETGGEFEFRIRGVEDRLIRIQVFKEAETCRARSFTTINGNEVIFEHIEIEVSGWANVHRVEIFGLDVLGQTVSEITHSD